MKQIRSWLDWLSKNSEKIFITVGKIAILLIIVGLLVWITLSTLQFITSIPGFQFDPLLIIVLLLIGFIFNRQMSNVNEQIKEIKEIQQKTVESREIVRVKKSSKK